MKLCIKEEHKLLEIPATHKYNQLGHMCEECFNKVVETIEAVTHNKIDKDKYLLNKKDAPSGRLSW